jgi:hypothetical protein
MKSSDVIQITRENLSLGSLSVGETLELLRLGFFQETDCYSQEGMAKRHPLAALAELTLEEDSSGPNIGGGPINGPAPAGSWLGRTRHSVTNAAGVVATSVGGLASRLKSLAAETPSVVSQATNKVLEGYLPQIRLAVQKVVASRPVAALQAGARNDEVMRKTFGAVYDCLPKPVCRFVDEERFIQFCLKHRTRLTGAESGAAPTDPSSPPS